MKTINNILLYILKKKNLSEKIQKNLQSIKYKIKNKDYDIKDHSILLEKMHIEIKDEFIFNLDEKNIEKIESSNKDKDTYNEQFQKEIYNNLKKKLLNMNEELNKEDKNIGNH